MAVSPADEAGVQPYRRLKPQGVIKVTGLVGHLSGARKPDICAASAPVKAVAKKSSRREVTTFRSGFGSTTGVSDGRVVFSVTRVFRSALPIL